MFTQCPKCETVFRLPAEALRAAGGQVRCGRCGEVFNALARLAEEAGGFTRGESPLFLETRAEEILESSSSALPVDLPAPIEATPVSPVSPESLDLAPGIEQAQLHFVDGLDDELISDSSLEFTLPPGELDRIFVETRPSPLQQLAGEPYRGGDVIPLHRDRPPDQSDALTAHPESKPSSPPPSTPLALESADLPMTPLPVPVGPAAPVAPVGPVVRVAGGQQQTEVPLTRIPGLEVSDDVRREMLSSFQFDPRLDTDESQLRLPARPRLPFIAWLGAAIVLFILLAIQIVSGSGGWLSDHVPLSDGSRSARSNLSVYQLRQWGVTGDPGANGTLRVRASIMNTAATLTPYPLLRVTLVNRFGTRVAAREFAAAEYLGHSVARMLAPGERIDATLDILDPGKEAEGFEIDVCVRSVEKQLLCAGDKAAPKQ